VATAARWAGDTAAPSSASSAPLLVEQHDEWAEGRRYLRLDVLTRLREIHQTPPLLFAADPTVPDDVGIAVVRSRKASPQGLKIAPAIAGALADLRITVV
jgi:DNA processing protein